MIKIDLEHQWAPVNKPTSCLGQQKERQIVTCFRCRLTAFCHRHSLRRLLSFFTTFRNPLLEVRVSHTYLPFRYMTDLPKTLYHKISAF